MYWALWVTAFVGAIWAANALYVRETVRSAPFMAIINIALWAIVGLGSMNVEVVDPSTGETIVYESEALLIFGLSMATFAILVFVLSITVGYAEDDGSDEPDMNSLADIGTLRVRD